jgi:hypothetical protein
MAERENPVTAHTPGYIVQGMWNEATIGAAFAGAVSAHGDRPFLAVPADAARGYLPSGFEI